MNHLSLTYFTSDYIIFSGRLPGITRIIAVFMVCFSGRYDAKGRDEAISMPSGTDPLSI
jgi:hypothetical protein